MPSGKSFVVGAIDGKQIRRCALSGTVLGAFVPENPPIGYRYY